MVYLCLLFVKNWVEVIGNTEYFSNFVLSVHPIINIYRL